MGLYLSTFLVFPLEKLMGPSSEVVLAILMQQDFKTDVDSDPTVGLGTAQQEKTLARCTLLWPCSVLIPREWFLGSRDVGSPPHAAVSPDVVQQSTPSLGLEATSPPGASSCNSVFHESLLILSITAILWHMCFCSLLTN